MNGLPPEESVRRDQTEYTEDAFITRSQDIQETYAAAAQIKIFQMRCDY